jgi:hypothetical protein
MLDYLRMQKEEIYAKTLNKLGVKLCMGHRYVQEKLNGLEDWGIIEVFTNEFNNKKWRWKGIKAIRDNGDNK